MNYDNKTFVDVRELSMEILKFIGSEEYNKIIKNTLYGDSSEFTSGIVLGMSLVISAVVPNVQEYILGRVAVENENK